MNAILVPIDFSDATSAVTTAAAELARVTSGRLIFIHVLPSSVIVGNDLVPLAGEAIELTADAEQDARHQLRRLRTRFTGSGVPVEVLCERGATVPTLLECARRFDARYIVTGSHGHSAFYDLVVGSTTHGLLKNAPCPVLIVPDRVAAAKRGPRAPLTEPPVGYRQPEQGSDVVAQSK